MRSDEQWTVKKKLTAVGGLELGHISVVVWVCVFDGVCWFYIGF